MKKIFRMANAELSKIFMRPSMFVLTGILVVVLIFSFVFFSPAQTSSKKTYEYSNTTLIHSAFLEDYQEMEKELISTKQSIDTYTSPAGNTYKKFAEDFHSLKLYMCGDSSTVGEFKSTILSIDYTQDALSYEDRQKCLNVFSTAKAKVNNLVNYMIYNIKDSKINFIITKGQYDKIYKTLSNLYSYLPDAKDLESYTSKMVKDRYNFIVDNYDIAKLDVEISKLETINISEEKLNTLLNDYYYCNFTTTSPATHSGKLLEYFNKVEDYYNENIALSNDEDVINQLNEYVAEYYSYIQICNSLISNNFELLRIGEKTDDQIANYVSFNNESIYNLKSEATKSKYLFDTNNFEYNYLSAFNFNKNSGVETNAYDFSFYALQILSAFIIFFVVFFATSGISGEQNSGTLKMTATRPFTRNKIYSGKFLACFNVALILLSISLVTSLAVGFAVYGFTFQNVMVVVNANSLIIVNPLILMILNLISILIDVIFYIALAILISMLIKQPTISTSVTNIIFIASTVTLGTVSSSWIRFIPSLNLQLYKFFTTSSTGLFSYSIVPNTSLLSCGLVAILSIFAFDVLGRLLFTHRSLDK